MRLRLHDVFSCFMVCVIPPRDTSGPWLPSPALGICMSIAWLRADFQTSSLKATWATQMQDLSLPRVHPLRLYRAVQGEEMSAGAKKVGLRGGTVGPHRLWRGGAAAPQPRPPSAASR